MILHRFMSEREYHALILGKTLRNTTVHSRRGCHSTSFGFCFFAENPEDAAHWLSGIVDFHWCVTFDVPDDRICRSKGEYASQDSNGFFDKVMRTEYCRTTYNSREFKIIDSTCKFNGRYPNKAESDEILRTMFGLVPTHK